MPHHQTGDTLFSRVITAIKRVVVCTLDA